MKDPWPEWPEELRESADLLIGMALSEDLDQGDITALHFALQEEMLTARLVARQSGRLAGMPIFLQVFQRLADGDIEFLECRDDGSDFEAGEVLARLRGPAVAIHSAERTALNFLQRLSAVATRTNHAMQMSVGPMVLDTRKTTPGYRLLEKYAVRMGGGQNHRMGLFDAVMVKDNHKDALGGVDAVMKKIAILPEGFPVYVEVDNKEELKRLLAHAAKSRVSRVLLDNFSPADVVEAVFLRHAMGGGPDFEISGSLRAEDLSDPRYKDVEYASLGSLTHAAGSIDFALEVEA